MKVDSIHLAKINNTSYKGKNVVVGVFDTGIDFKHLDFCSDVDPTKTRILSIWDQFGTGTPPAGFNYGVEYSQTQINNEIDGTPANVVKAIDDNGHGTHVASTAAGDGSSYSITKYIGVAPEADLIIVDGGNDGFASTNVIDGMNYIKNKSVALGKPFAINLSLGGHWGAHDGTDPQKCDVGNNRKKYCACAEEICHRNVPGAVFLIYIPYTVINAMIMWFLIGNKFITPLVKISPENN